MSVAETTRTFISTVEDGRLFTYKDIPCPEKSSVAIELSRLFKKGVIKKVSKGKFYKPKKRSFGELEPSSIEKIESLITSTDDIVYETGCNVFRKLGLTTQVANEITLATNKPYKKVSIDNINVKFVPIRVNAQKDDIYLLQILDALKDIKRIPATTPTETVQRIAKIIGSLSSQELEKMVSLALKYTPRTRALLGAILQSLGEVLYLDRLKSSLNPLTSYKIELNKEVLQNTRDWNII
ncbi:MULTISPECIES: DUF6088 family protein [Pasteurellaceae]|uniref:DUF6088 family protein n=1 Tax=Pasteurella atlantica TaxID=2827233 RepID=A0AAW8CL71_9PAST|nr:DUF6088 family protein [Pasteurella atlantica]MBR0573437.1 hypothetical protein [Pasteurella atlantica]MDP8039438.1 DUF6088 family protein [Pasteurella atlantica]MDP8041529.1 DUF6088 family protein [Pasteurella atlantica]MDP8043666.1 DUF6088 family protein [Pasteurella atlantica]MDP8045837.1 DUF6088 family protein [Pasteurella atlantica]